MCHVVPKLKLELYSLFGQAENLQIVVSNRKERVEELYGRLMQQDRDMLFNRLKSLRDYVTSLEKERDEFVRILLPEMTREKEELDKMLLLIMEKKDRRRKKAPTSCSYNNNSSILCECSDNEKEEDCGLDTID